MSIDVGIKNLSFVIFDTQENTDKTSNINILKDSNNNLLWNILDITPAEYNHVCSYKSKTGKVCGKSSVIKYKNSQESFCNLHKKHMAQNETVIYFDRNKISLDDIYQTLVKKMDKFFSDNQSIAQQLKIAIIEKQPPNNPRMKAIMSVIHSYFIIRGKVDNYCGLSLQEIFIIDAKHKLSIYKGPFVDASHLKKKYDQRKYLSVAYTKNLIQENSEYLKHFDSYEQKKDDLADCYLQAKYFAEKIYKKKKSACTQNNMIQLYKDIDLSKTKKSLIYSDKRISKAKSINLYTMKKIIQSRNLNKSNIKQYPYYKLVENCSKKYFGNIDFVWDFHVSPTEPTN